MRNKLTLIFALPALLSLVVLTAACAHSTLGKLVGSDRDAHGCIGSAGYTWSYALHDCVRLWEAGIRFDAGPKQVYVVFSTDSTYAEIFAADAESVLCKREKQTDVWRTKKGREWVKIQNNVICVNVDDFTYTQNRE